MASTGTASPISAQDAKDLLNKFITEHTKLQVLLRTSNNNCSGLHGILGAASPTLLVAKPGDSPGAPFLSFTPGAAASFAYAAGRAIPDTTLPQDIRFTSGLVLIYPDSSQVYLLEIAEAENDS
jgi:hypothetical protein